MGVTITTYDPLNGLQSYEGLEHLSKIPNDVTIWVDIESTEPEALQQVASHFGLHELSVEDCLTPGHFPKLDNFGEYIFMLFRGLTTKDMAEERSDSSEGPRYTRKIALYLSRRFVITFRRHEVAWLDAIVRQVHQLPDTTIARGTDVLAHRIIYVLVDRFERGLEVFDDQLDILEDHISTDNAAFNLGLLLDIKRELVTIRQTVKSQRLMVLRLSSEPSPFINKNRRRYFKDIDDRAHTLLNTIDKLIESIQGMRDTYFAISNIRLGDTMRFLAVITTVLAPLNIIVGLYGMNFEAMPLLHNPVGFWVIVVLLVLVSVLMLVVFRRKRWL